MSPSHETTNYFPSKKWSICVNLIFGKCYLLTINRLLFHTCFGIMSMIKTIGFLKRFSAKQVRPCSDEGATVNLVPQGETQATTPALLNKARITDSKIKLAFRRTAVFSTNFHQQVTLYTVTWGRNVELVLGGSKKRPTLNTFCGTILDDLLKFKKTKRVCIMI